MSTRIDPKVINQTYDSAISTFHSKRDKELMGETSFGIGPLRVPKKLGPINFINEDNVNRIQEKYQKMEDITGQIMDQLTKMLDRISASGRDVR